MLFFLQIREEVFFFLCHSLGIQDIQPQLIGLYVVL